MNQTLHNDRKPNVKTKTILTSLGLALSLFAASAKSFAAPVTADEAKAASPAATMEQKSAGDMAEIAKKLNNPVASLISVPFQNNFDFGGGPEDDGFLRCRRPTRGPCSATFRCRISAGRMIWPEADSDSCSGVAIPEEWSAAA